jgi:hypothetical protein
MAKVLKVVISVVAPEKSIVPWAWATPAIERTKRVGVIVRMADRREDFRKGYARRMPDGIASRLQLASDRMRRRNRFTLHLR